ncbi:glycosyltransferase [Demequina iriomotensis]|uniref:glycosyltransferase n=1 Tax=Demequina iriomotensis TaxID=1536641 RepID=UPI0007862F5B|nr:glycosyltransferase [Demequina iriomotensis]
MLIVIPAYEPDARLAALVRSLRPRHDVLVVDDGSGPRYAAEFAAARAAGATLVAHGSNRGKAAALRTGMRWALAHRPGHAVVCADSDGQHLPEDVEAVAAVLERRAAAGLADAVVLGARAFTGDVPWRSRVGNRAASAAMALVSGLRLGDTQTGLRGYPPGLLAWAVEVRGERFAYELRLLLEAARHGIPVIEVRIGTVYMDGNAGSHFRPLRDSARIVAPLALFAASSLGAFALDAALLLALRALTGSLALAVVGARLVSAGANFAVNRRAVFRSHGPVAAQAARYAALAAGILVASYLSLALLTQLGVPLLLAKVITDLGLWVLSFGIQRAAVFPAARSRRHDVKDTPGLRQNDVTVW